MGDDSLRHYKMGRGFHEDDSANRGYSYAYIQSQNSNNGSKSEENLFGPSYLKENQKSRSNLNQTKIIVGKEMLKNMENRRSSPSVVAKLMGVNEIPPQKGLYSNNKTSACSFRKIPEFKDVFEVIEERKKQQNGKGQIRKKCIQDEKFGDKSYRDRFVKDLEKSNSLVAKRLHDLKCSPPHLHKNPVFVENPKMRNLGDFNAHKCFESQKMRNLGLKMGNYNYNHDDHIVVLNPKFGDFDLDPNLERTFQRKFSDNLENRRGKDGNYKGSFEKFEKLRKFESSLGIYEKGPKTLAEMLALSNSENFSSRNYNKKVSKVRSDREINYEKDEGSFVILPRYLSRGKSCLYEREDVARLRARNQKLRENLISVRNFSSSRFSEEDIYARKHDLRGFFENDFENEEKTLFTIGEGQKVGTNSTSEEKEGHFSKYCDRIKLLKQTEQPSPVSVLEPASTEEETSSSGFVKDELDTSSCIYIKGEQEASSSCYLKENFVLHDSDMQDTEEPEIYISSDEENNKNNNKSTLNLLRDREEREFSYLLDMLIQSGVYGPHIDMLRKACHSRTCPIDPRFFDRLERKYNQMLTWSKSERRLLFDYVNLVLALVLGPCLDPHPWVGGERKVGGWGPEGLLEKVWMVLERERKREKSDDDVVDSDWSRDLGDDVNVIGKRIERMLTDEMLEETVLGFISDY